MPYSIGLQLRKHALNSLIEVELLLALMAWFVQQSLKMPVELPTTTAYVRFACDRIEAKFRLMVRDVRITLPCLPFILIFVCPFIKILISSVLILQLRFLSRYKRCKHLLAILFLFLSDCILSIELTSEDLLQ